MYTAGLWTLLDGISHPPEYDWIAITCARVPIVVSASRGAQVLMAHLLRRQHDVYGICVVGQLALQQSIFDDGRDIALGQV